MTPHVYAMGGQQTGYAEPKQILNFGEAFAVLMEVGFKLASSNSNDTLARKQPAMGRQQGDYQQLVQTQTFVGHFSLSCMANSKHQFNQ